MIATFYSFKGGVGRSMALANIAEYLHAKGLSVAMIDWDLEAPGLESYFYPAKVAGSNPNDFVANSELSGVRSRPGLVDLLYDYKAKYPEFRGASTSSVLDAGQAGQVPYQSSTASLSEEDRKAYAQKVDGQLEGFPDFFRESVREHIEQVPKATANIDPPPTFELFLDSIFSDISKKTDGLTVPFSSAFVQSPLRGYLQCIHPPDSGRNNGLLLLTAGARQAKQFSGFAAAVQDFDWAEFYGIYAGAQFFEWLRTRLRQLVDVVLIDSRTGVTEMGGICTRVMADLVVCFCAPNSQNLEGVGKIIDGLKIDSRLAEPADKHQIDVIAVPTRIDDAESNLLDRFRRDFTDDVQSKAVPDRMFEIDDPLWSLRIPYIPQFNYLERRVIGPSPEVPAKLDPPSERLALAYRQIAASMAVLAAEGSGFRQQFAGELATLFPQLQKPRTPDMAPKSPENYVPRYRETESLRNLLRKTSQVPGISRIAVTGPSCSGKTALVATVCNDLEIKHAYPGGIVWLQCDRGWTAETIEDFLRDSFGLGRSFRGARLEEFLAARNFLFVADSVWDPADLRPIFKFGRQCTQLVITTDASTASAFSETVLPVGMLSDEEVAFFLGADAVPRLASVPDADPNVASLIVHWPLTASLLRSALDRRLAQRESLDQAWHALAKSVALHGIVAFDQLSTSERNASVSRTLTRALGHLKPEARDLLLKAANAHKAGSPIEAGLEVPQDPPEIAQRAKQLDSLGLATFSGGVLRVHEIVYSWLFASGQVGRTSSKSVAGPRLSSSESKRLAEDNDVGLAKKLLRGQSAALQEIIDLAERLYAVRFYGYARRLFELARQQPDAARLPADRKLKLAQRLALTTYRDPDLPAAMRFTGALSTLESADMHPPDPSLPEPCQETLGLAGAIHKYKWNFNGQRSEIEHSYFEYARGAKQPIEGDFGYTRINAAFVADLLAKQQENEAPEICDKFRSEARRLREEIVSALPLLGDMPKHASVRQQFWYPATLAEAYFGLQRFEEARFWLREAAALGAPEWQLESLTRQLAMLANSQHGEFQENSPAWSCLHLLVGDSVAAVRTVTAGKVGLALSGGGFRASLFHIGVLARLADLDMLRHVEVLSCVSGGSIIGAQYYLEVRQLLHKLPDAEITRQHYIEIVQRIQRDFLRAVQTNPRTRLFANLAGNVRSLLYPSYSRTNVLGEFFEDRFYRRPSGVKSGPIRLDELKISPNGWTGDFNPKLDNWRRAAKAPMLLLNATALNTGHNWQFAVNWMGEPPLGASDSVDRNDVLRRMYYWEAPKDYRNVRLGDAVAASACVPLLFDPIEMPDLYPGETLRLVDGGVHDNQGVGGLIEQECRVVIVSDASGQMNSEPKPSSSAIGVPLRTNSILQARVREAQFRELDSLSKASALTGFAFLHLKRDLLSRDTDWTDCPDPTAEPKKSVLTPYGIPTAVQTLLAGVRTDLDSFSDVEAYALMLSGYRMAREYLPQCVPQLASRSDIQGSWDFLAIENAVTADDESHERLMRILRAAPKRSAKIFRLTPLRALPGLLLAIVILVALALGPLVFFYRSFRPFVDPLLSPFFKLFHIPMNLLTTLIASSLASFFLWLAVCSILAVLLWLGHRGKKSFTIIATGLLMIPFGSIVAMLHIFLSDPQYLAYGKVSAKRN
jgi:predicted acylesterase/phospholipase RssA